MDLRIAFLGLGHMGQAMAGRLVAAGHDVSVYNRTPAKARALVRQGATLAATPRAAAEGAKIVFAMVGDDAASRRVWLGSDGALAAKLAAKPYAVECSTLSHAWLHRLAKQVARKGVRFVDCPVTGIPVNAAAGELILFVGAERRDITALRPVFKTLAKEVVHFGPVGAGNAYKLMINLMGSVQIAALAEGLVIADRAGLDRRVVVETVLKGAAASPQVMRNARQMLAGRHERDIVFPGKWRHKDAAYGLKLARALGVAAPFGTAAVRGFRRLIDAGFGEANESKIVDVLGARPRRRR
jgi:3-hydroxyisobutyrate dehydrogenase